MDAPIELNMAHKLANLFVTMREKLHWDVPDLFTMSLVNKEMSNVANQLLQYNRPPDMLKIYFTDGMNLASYSAFQRKQVVSLITCLLKEHQEDIKPNFKRAIQSNPIQDIKEDMIIDICEWLIDKSLASRAEVITFFSDKLRKWDSILGPQSDGIRGRAIRFRDLLKSIVKGLTEHNFLITNSIYASSYKLAKMQHVHNPQNMLRDFVLSNFMMTEPEERFPFTHLKQREPIDDFDMGNFPKIASESGGFMYPTYPRAAEMTKPYQSPIAPRDFRDLGSHHSPIAAPKSGALTNAFEEASTRVKQSFFSQYRPPEQQQEVFQKSEVKKPVVQPHVSSEHGFFSSNQPPVIIEPVAEIPEEFCCAISYELMEDPVQIAPFVRDKNNYERAIILQWLRQRETSPFTLEKLSADPVDTKKLLPEQFWFTPNVKLKAAIDAFKEKSAVQENPEENSLSC